MHYLRCIADAPKTGIPGSRAAARIKKLETALTGLAEAAWLTVRQAKGACGEFNPHIDCSVWLKRGRRCPECPYWYVQDLEDLLLKLGMRPE